MGQRARVALVGTLVCALSVTAGMSPAGAAKKKGKKKAPSVAAVTKTVNAPIPQVPVAIGPSVPVISTIEIGKQFKGKVVADVDVTGIATTGSASGAANDLDFKLTAPSGHTVRVIDGVGDQNLGPWTLDDETPVSICDSATPGCSDPFLSLLRPFAGTSNLEGLAGGASGPLSILDGLPMRGTWTLSVHDDSGVVTTSNLVSWGLRVTPAKPPKGVVATKKKRSPSSFEKTSAASVALPDATLAGLVTPITSTISVPKSFAGRVVGDVNVTGIKTTGSSVGAANQLAAFLIAPNGRTIRLFENFGDQSLGPWTLDDDTRRGVCDSPDPDCRDADASLLHPYAGTSNMIDTAGDTGTLAAMNGVPMAGDWKFVIQDLVSNITSTFNGWGLKLAAAKPVVAPRPSVKKSAAASAKKKGKAKKKQKSSVAITQPVGVAVPQDAAAGASVPLRSTITIADKAFKGKTVGDLNVTGIKITGSATGAANDLVAKLTAPNGRTIRLFTSFGDISLGPWTLDDDATAGACDSVLVTDCAPPLTVLQPFAGTTNLLDLGTIGSGRLSTFNGAPIRGTWTFTVFDQGGATTASTLNSWGLAIAAAKPITG